MGGFVAPGDALRGDNGINHRLFRQQPQGVRQRSAIPQHGADDRFTFHHRSMKLRIDKAFLQQLLAQLGEQRLLIHRLIHHPEVGGIEVLIQHPRTGTVHQHQLADLIQLIVGGERRDGHYRLVFFADPHR